MELNIKNQRVLDRYNLCVRRYLWGANCFKKLKQQANRHGTPNITEYSWNRKISCYYVELFNFPHDKEELFASFVSSTAKAFGLSIEKVVEIVNDSNDKSNSEEKELPKLAIQFDKAAKSSLVSCGEYISYKIPNKLLNKIGNDPHFLETFINYYSLNPSSGSFWSLGLKTYEVLQSSDKGIISLECFASPFNYNIKSFCSAFSSDRKLDYDDDTKCYGDFFSYINILQSYKHPVRLILNPPYTDRIIDAMASKVVDYMAEHADGEFIAVLPDWTDQPGMVSLMNIEGSVSQSFGSGTFKLWNPIEETNFAANFKMIAIVNIRHDSKQSEEKLKRLVEVATISGDD